MAMDLPFGKRFQPTDEELVGYFLKKHLFREPINPAASAFFREGPMYGPGATPWELFDYGSCPWQTPVDPLGKVEVGVGVLYFVTKLSNVGQTEKSAKRMKNRVAGCGSWHGNKSREPIYSSASTTKEIIGYKRSFTFRSSGNQATVGQWNMVEYNINAEHYRVPPDSEDYVLCKIKRDDTKSSVGGRLVSWPTNMTATASIVDSTMSGSMVAETSSAAAAQKKRKPGEVDENQFQQTVETMAMEEQGMPCLVDCSNMVDNPDTTTWDLDDFDLDKLLSDLESTQSAPPPLAVQVDNNNVATIMTEGREDPATEEEEGEVDWSDELDKILDEPSSSSPDCAAMEDEREFEWTDNLNNIVAEP